MVEFNSPNIYSNLNDQQLRLNKICEVRDYFIGEIKERELKSKRLSKYIASFDYFNKSLIVLSVATSSISVASFATVIGTPLGIGSASFSLAFLISKGIVKKLLKRMQNEKKKKIVMLARSKLISIESKISEALINNETSNEAFMVIINKEKTIVNLKKASK